MKVRELLVDVDYLERAARAYHHVAEPFALDPDARLARVEQLGGFHVARLALAREGGGGEEHAERRKGGEEEFFIFHSRLPQLQISRPSAKRPRKDILHQKEGISPAF